MRLFFAIDLPRALAGTVAALQVDPGPRTRVRWVSPETLHITVRFLGEVDEEHVPALITAVREVTTCHAPLALSIEGGGAFPPRGRPSVLWVGVGGDAPGLTALSADVEEAVVSCGLPPQSRPYRPHLTIGRVKEGRAETALERLRALGSLGDFTALEVILYRSETRPDGAVHHVLQRIPLGGGPSEGGAG